VRALGVVALVAAAAAATALALVPAAVPWGLLPTLGMAALGAASLRLRPAEHDAPRLASRVVGGTLALVACGFCVYWPVFARRLVHSAQLENDAVAAALEPGVPTYLVGSTRASVTPDDLFTGAPGAVFLESPAEVPPASAVPRADLVVLEAEREAAVAARGQAPVEALRRVRRDGRTLFVLRFRP
jgi:hypothetical protein